jgi:hypothetical protein
MEARNSGFCAAIEPSWVQEDRTSDDVPDLP